MPSLEELIQIKGAVGALRFYDDGSLAESAGDLPREHADLAADMCNATSRMMQQEANLFAAYSGMAGWTPSEGWMMQGEEISVWTLGNIACFVNNDEVSYNELVKVLNRLAHR